MTFNFHLLKELYQFKHHLEPKGAHQSAKHFNYQLLEKAAEMLRNQTMNENLLFYDRHIFGYIERFIPANDSQNLAQGLGCIIENEQEQNHTFQIGLFMGKKTFPLNSYPDNELGYHYAVQAPQGALTYLCQKRSKLPELEEFLIPEKQMALSL